MRVFVQVILISCLFNTQTTEGQVNDKLPEKEENWITTHLLFKEFTTVDLKKHQACLEKSGGTQYYDLFTNECQSCESLENSHERYTRCPEYQLKKTNTELEKADKELKKADKKLEQADTELEKKLEQANKEMEKKLELMELETKKQVASSNTLAIIAIVPGIVFLTVIIAFVVRYCSRTLRSQDGKQNNIEENIKFLKTNGDPSTDETSFLIANEESSTEPHHIPKLLDIRGWNDDLIRKLFQKIQHSSSKIEEMEIWMNPQLGYVSDVVKTFPHFTRDLNLVLHGGVDVERRRFCRNLTEEIINFDTSKLQTQELKVEVRDGHSPTITYDGNRSAKILLEVVLPRGEPHRFIKLDMRGWNDDEIRKLLQTIQHSSTKIEGMKITMKPQQLENVRDVVATFPHLTRKLKLVLVGGADDRRRFCRKLTEEIINFDTSKLQTQELKVEVRGDRYFSTRTFLEVVLRRGKPPQFTKLDISGWNDDEIRKLFQTIQHSSSKIEEMVILMKPLLEHVSDVVETFPHFTTELKLVLFGGDVDERQRFCEKLTEEIINFDNSKLQTEELKVKVRDVDSTTLPRLEVVLRRGKPPQFIKLDIRGWNDDEIRKLFQTIQHSPSKIEEMEITMKPQLELVSDVVATFPHFTRKLKVELDGKNDDELREFCRKLTEEITNFDTSKLQTQELKVEVRYSTIFLEVVLRPGEPPQFIKFSIYEWNDENRKLFQTIQHSSTKIEEMKIMMKSQVEHVSDVVATFPLLTRKLKLVLVYGGDDERRRRFCIKLTEEIINFDTSKLQTQELKVEVYFGILLEVVLRRGKPPQFTKFSIYKWNDENRKLLQTIQHSSTKIEEMRIWMKSQLEHVSDVVATFPHLTRKLELKLFGGDVDDRPEFYRKLMEEIMNFETSKLQTEELKVEVRFSTTIFYRSTKNFLLEVVLRRGEPPQFSKFSIYEWNDEIRKFLQTIQHLSTKTEEMEITMRPQLKHVSDVVATFPLLTRKLKLLLDGKDDVELREFCIKLTEEIINFDTSKLKTEELKVEIGDDQNYSTTIFLEVVLRCGKPPHFINNFLDLD